MSPSASSNSPNLRSKYRLAVFAPHPVQYHAGIYRELAKLEDVDTTVFYEDRVGLEPVYVKEFNTTIQWDIDLLGGYKHQFLKNYARNSEGGFFARINPGVIPVILKGNYDAVLLQSYCRLTDWLVFAASKSRGKPLLFRGEATLRPRRARVSMRSRLKSRFLSRFLRRCNVVLYSCIGNREYYTHYGVPDEQMRLIPCAVDNDFFQRERCKLETERPAIREKLGIASTDFVIVFAAQMTPRKCPSDLIEAASRIDHGHVVLLFIGDGPERERLESLSHERGVHAVFTGFVNQGEISRFYAVGDLFAMLSAYDASPKALNEAMNFSMPVISTTMPGTAYDLVKPDQNGFLIEVGDVGALAEKIDWLNRNRAEAAEMGRRSLEIVKGWNFEADAQAIREAIHKVCPRN